jgi:hypothetical protein
MMCKTLTLTLTLALTLTNGCGRREWNDPQMPENGTEGELLNGQIRCLWELIVFDSESMVVGREEIHIRKLVLDRRSKGTFVQPNENCQEKISFVCLRVSNAYVGILVSREVSMTTSKFWSKMHLNHVLALD